MKASSFNITGQNQDVASKIVAGLERIAEAYRVLLWQHAKTTGLSPIQIQIIIFTFHHDDALCNVSHLAKEFNVTKPTISDAIKVLVKKNLIFKDYSPTDKRAFTVALTDQGKEIAANTEYFAQPIKTIVQRLDDQKQAQLFSSIHQLISELNRTGILSVQRNCFRCKFYERKQSGHFCHLLKKDLLENELRIDCKEFETP